MQLDNVEIRIGGYAIKNLLDYEADSDLLQIADAFSCRTGKLTPTEAKVIKTGAEFDLFVNGVMEMRGLVERARKSHSKTELSAEFTGRDVVGIAIDTCPLDYATLPQKNLKTLALHLFKDLPYIQKERIIFDPSANGLPQKAFKRTQFQIGATNATVLADFCQRVGCIFWIQPDGTITFGKLKTSGSPEFYFYMYTDAKLAVKNNVLSVEEDDNISERYSLVRVVGCTQSEDSWEPGKQQVSGQAVDKKFPFYKPFVKHANMREGSAKSQAEHEITKRMARGYTITATVGGHSQNGKNYRANNIAYLVDQDLGIDGHFLMLRRKLRMNKQEGQKTEITMGLPIEGYAVQ